MLRLLFAMTLVLCTSVCLAGADTDNYGTAVITEVTSIYDGDTFRANIAHWPPIVGNRISVRIKGIDAPELKGRCDQEKKLARLARQMTVEMLRAGEKIELHNLQRDKYFRVLADVHVGGKDLGAALLKAGLARPYNGGTKKDWCPAAAKTGS